eukprot:Colp12_sorted_trinity150504_noHs@36489
MGCRAIVILKFRGRCYVFWNPYDSYPSRLGKIIARDLLKVWSDIFNKDTESLIKSLENNVIFDVKKVATSGKLPYELWDMWEPTCKYDPTIPSETFALSKYLCLGYAHVEKIVEPDASSNSHTYYIVDYEYWVDLDNETVELPRFEICIPFSKLQESLFTPEMNQWPCAEDEPDELAQKKRAWMKEHILGHTVTDEEIKTEEKKEEGAKHDCKADEVEDDDAARVKRQKK